MEQAEDEVDLLPPLAWGVTHWLVSLAIFTVLFSLVLILLSQRWRARLLSLTCVLLLLCVGANSQRRNSTLVAQDDVLFTQADYENRSGWRWIAGGTTNASGELTLFYYDPARVMVGEPNRVKAWIRTEDWKDGTSISLLSSSLDLHEYDCTHRKRRLLEIHVYDKDNQPKTNVAFVGPWTEVIPDTVAETMFGVLCLGRKDKDQIEMETAAEWFKSGRQAEKKGARQAALSCYKAALEHATDNKKILSAIRRIEP
jgi:hypothetical protein